MSVEVDGAAPRVENRIGSEGAVQERLPTGFERLKPGPGHSREEVRASQRSRIHRAMIELAAEGGYERVTVRSLARTAGVSSRTFYGHFLNREECLASTIDCVGHGFLWRAARTKANRAGWDNRLKASLRSLFGDLARQPKAARVLLIEARSADRPPRARAKGLTTDFEQLLTRLLAASPLTDAPPHRLVTGIAAGVIRVATMTTLTDRADELEEMSTDVGDWVVEIYDAKTAELSVGPRAGEGRARRERSPLPAELSSMAGYGDRERILAAVSRLATEKGFAGLSVSRIRREAGVSRRAFDARFDDTTECFLAAVDSLARGAVKKAATWAAGTRAGGDRRYRRTLALCAIAARNQPLARLVLAEIVVPGRDGLLGRERLISAAVEQLVEEEPASSLRIVGLEASVAAAWRIAEDDVLADGGRRLPEAARLLSSLLALDS